MSEQFDLFGNPTSKPKGRKPAAKPKAYPPSPKDEVVHLRFEDAHQIRIVTVDGEPWWVAVDLCRVLDIGNSRQALSRLDEDEKRGVITNDAISRKQELAIVSEAGMYSLVLTSRKPEAKRFKRWVVHEVLPSIRKHGIYSVAGPAAKIQNKLKCDAPTAILRLSLVELNKLLHDTIKAHGGHPWEYGAFHNAIYDVLAESSAKELRAALGLPKSATPLDRFGRTLLSHCTWATEMTISKIEGGGIPRGEELKFFKDSLRRSLDSNAQVLGEGFCLGLIHDEMRGTIYDVVQPGLAKPA